MARFKYSAVDKKNKVVDGSIEATSKVKATELLTKQGYKPILVKEEKAGFDPNNLQFKFLRRKSVKSKDLVIFTRQLATMINAGVPLVRSLATLQSQTQSTILKEVLEQVSKDVEGGSTLADALQKHPKTFSPVFYNMVAAGEAGGILDDILKKLALQQEKDASMRKKIKSAMAYPTVLIGITVIAFFALTLFIIPKLGKIITDLGGEDAQLPIYTKILLGFSSFMTNYWFIVFGLLFGAAVLFKRYISTEKGRRNFDRALLKIPIIKTIILKVAIARFARTFASLMSSGVSVLDSIHVTAKAIGNKIIEEELENAAKEVTKGKQLSEPLSTSKIFPPIVAQMLSVGEETGQTDTILIKVADFYEEEVDTLVDGLASIIEPVMIVILGSLVGVIAVSVLGPITSLTENIGG